MISAANLFIANDVAVLGGAATLPDHRGRGGQSALMSARIAAAAAAGCEWFSTETGAESDDDPNPSLHNMRRLGFVELYERTNWIYRRD
jgi:GNAT superfamily N-acetyltransferase